MLSSTAHGGHRFGLAVVVAVLLGLAMWVQPKAEQPQAQKLPPGAFAQNVEVVAYLELFEKVGFKMVIQEVAGRWYLYLGHPWVRGWGIVDVTDPAAPQYLKLIPGPDNTSTVQIDWAGNGRMLTPLSRLLDNRDETKPNEGGFYLWDLSDPVTPKKLGQYRSLGTHRNWYDGGRYVYAAALLEGYQGNIFVVIDVGDPANPVEVSRWWHPGQHIAGGEKPEPGVGLHGPPALAGNLAYLPYNAAGLIILDISDVKRPQLVGQLDFSPPFKGNLGLHGVLLLPDQGGRKYAFVNSEADHGCPQQVEVAQLAGIVDVTDPKRPYMVGQLPRPAPPPGYPQADFCDHGQFGPHNTNTTQWSPHVERQGDLVYVTYQTGGLHIFDIADPRAATRVGYFVPPDPVKRYGPNPRGPVLYAVTENVLVDARGYIYIVDRNQGVFVLRYTGPKSRWRSNP